MFAIFIQSADKEVDRTEVLLGGTTLLDNLNETGLQLLDGRNVVGEDTHITGGSGDVDLGTAVARTLSVKFLECDKVGHGGIGNAHASGAVDGLLESRLIS